MTDVICEQFNKFKNTLKKGEEETKNKYPWLDQGNERRNMSDREILDKYANCEKKLICQIQKGCKSWIYYTNIRMHLV